MTNTTLESLTLNQKNIVRTFISASSLEQVQGRAWYSTARTMCQELSKRYNVPFLTVVSVLAVLSPATVWEDNVKNTERMLEDYRTGSINLEKGAYNLYLFNIKKAYSLLNNQDMVQEWINQDVNNIKSGHKTVSFANNISGNEDYVTVDRHAYRVWKTGLNDVDMSSVTLSKKQYNLVANDYRIVAEYLNVTPATLQAVTWVAMRNYLHPTQDK